MIVLALMAGVALPVYFDLQAEARESAIKGSLGGVRLLFQQQRPGLEKLVGRVMSDER